MAFQKTYSDEDIRTFKRKDNEVMLQCILKALSVVKEGTNKEITKEEVSDWFSWIKEKAEPEQEGDGMWFAGKWYPLTPAEAKKALETLKPF